MEKEFKPISKEEALKVLEAYFSWKEASEKVKKLNGRGINLHESISERLVCYLNNFSLAIGEGSYDAKSSEGKTIHQLWFWFYVIFLLLEKYVGIFWHWYHVTIVRKKLIIITINIILEVYEI